MTKVVLELPPDEARALAQFVKRLGFDDCQRLGSRYDGGVEAEAMWEGILSLQRALAEAGARPAMTLGRPSSGGRPFSYAERRVVLAGQTTCGTFKRTG
jgi:hypothetical protein